MELLRGESLGQLLTRAGPLDVSMATYVMAEVLSALGAAHAAGIVHRDIKPDNVFLVSSGRALPEVKLLDFGASQMIDPAHPGDRLTRTGVVLGTPYYMSPEQAEGDKAMDGRVDLYAVGVMLYEAVTGEVPFKADNFLALVRRILEAPLVRPRELAPELPEALESVILKAMARDRNARFATAADMLEALLPFVDERARAQIALPAPTAPQAESPARVAETSTLEPLVEGAPESQEPIAASPAQRAPAAPSRRGVPIAITSAVVAVCAIVVAALSWPQGTAPTSPTTSEAREEARSADVGAARTDNAVLAPEAPVTGAAAEPVTVTLAGVPDEAVVLVDGERVDGPTVRRPRSDRPSEVEVRLDDGRGWRGRVAFDRDHEVAIRLAPERRAPSSGGPNRHVQPRRDAGASIGSELAGRGDRDAGSSPSAPQPDTRAGGDPQLQTDFRL